MESHVRAGFQASIADRFYLKKIFAFINRFQTFKFTFRFPFFLLALSSLTFLSLSVPASIALCLCVLQYSYSRMEGFQFPGPVFGTVGRKEFFSTIRHDPASLLWAFCYLLIALYCFSAPLFGEETIIQYCSTSFLLIASVLPIAAAKSTLPVQVQKGYLTTVHSGFLAEAGKAESLVVSCLLFIGLPAFCTGGMFLLLGNLLFSLHIVIGVFLAAGSIFFLIYRRNIFVLGLPSLMESLRSFCPSVGLLFIGLGLFSSNFPGEYLGLSHLLLKDLFLGAGCLITFIGARQLESYRKGSEQPMYTHRKN